MVFRIVLGQRLNQIVLLRLVLILNLLFLFLLGFFLNHLPSFLLLAKLLLLGLPQNFVLDSLLLLSFEFLTLEHEDHLTFSHAVPVDHGHAADAPILPISDCTAAHLTVCRFIDKAKRPIVEMLLVRHSPAHVLICLPLSTEDI